MLFMYIITGLIVATILFKLDNKPDKFIQFFLYFAVCPILWPIVVCILVLYVMFE